MKPRCNTPLTNEDFAIWDRFGIPLWGYFESDRRDADLMLTAQDIAQHGDAAIELDGIQCRGWTQYETLAWP